MTPDQIQEKLNQVNSKALTGRTPDRFRQVTQQTGLFWLDVLEHFATEGYAWADAATFYGVKEEALRAYCRNRGAKFPWQGTRSERWRARRSAESTGEPFYRPLKKLYTVFGVTADLDTLIARFSPDGMTYPTAHSRIKRGWPIEEALTIPRGQKPGMGSIWRKQAA